MVMVHLELMQQVVVVVAVVDFNAPAGKNGGGSGIVVVRYKIATTDTAKATGGAISFYGGKTIHTFTQSLVLLMSRH